MAFEDFDDLARRSLKRAPMGNSRIVVRTEFSPAGRAQTLFRFSDDIVEKAHWTPGADRVRLKIDRDAMAIKVERTLVGGYKLLGRDAARAYVKFTAARGMPIADEPVEAADVVVVGGEVMFVLPQGVRIAEG
jgi:hypothetical protein